MAFFDDIHHIRLAAEESVVQQKAANILLTAIAVDSASSAASLKKLVDALSGPEVVGLEVKHDPPTTHP